MSTKRECPTNQPAGAVKKRKNETHTPEKTNIPGALYVADFLTPQEETQLLARIDDEDWLHDLSRRVQHYGWKYNYKERSVQPRDYLGPLPAWLRTLADRLVERKIAASDFDQVIVNEYLPGQGIGAHVDQPAMFAEEIVTVSLASATTMRFTPARHAASGEKKVQQIRLRPRSALLLKKEARYDWKHEIPRQKSDVVTSAEPGGTPCQGGLKFRVPRSRRVSVTFRCVKKPE